MNARRKEQPKQWTLVMMLIGARKATLARSSKNGNKASFTTLLSQLPAHYLMAFISLSPLCARMISFYFNYFVPGRAALSLMEIEQRQRTR